MRGMEVEMASFPVPSLDESSEVTTFLRDLIRIPSVNPPGNEAAVAAVVAAKLAEIGCDVKTYEAAPNRHNVVGRIKGDEPGPTLILNGHIDVQPAGDGWRYDPFGAEIVDGVVYGRGSMDMKAGITSMLFGLAEVVRTKQLRKGEVIFTAVADEVSGGHKGTGWLLENNLVQGDMAIVGEPTGDEIFIAHRGVVWMEVTVSGRSAHSGRPWLGVNAVSKVAAIIHAIEKELAPTAALMTHPMLPPPTYNFGRITGGEKHNLVADRCVLQVERRMLPGESAEECTAQVRGLCERLATEDTDEWSVEVQKVMHVDGAQVDPDGRAVAECRRAYHAIMGRDPGIGATSGFEDAHFFLQRGIDTAMFGPYRRQASEGGGKFFVNSGMADESVALADVATAIAIYATMIRNVLG